MGSLRKKIKSFDEIFQTLNCEGIKANNNMVVIETRAKAFVLNLQHRYPVFINWWSSSFRNKIL